MPPSNAASRVSLRQLVLWGAFMALLAIGVVLWFRFSGRMVSLFDALFER